MEQIGSIIKDIRKKNNLTQNEFASILGVTFQAVSKWENDKSIPDITILKDISNKKVDIVIVKDLSRLGRNYIEVGELLHSILPLYDVKLISINDNIDGLNDEEDSYLLKGLLNIYNESYPRDISNKVKTALTTKKINGEFVTSYAPYGYKKSRYEKNKIIIDTEAAKNVKMIFDSIEKGLSKKEIVDILNNKKIKTPMEYIKKSDEGKM